jgi:hypothetical protein
LIFELTRRLLDGPAPQHRILLAQLASATISNVQLTGVGLYASFEISANSSVEPRRLIGGCVPFEVVGVEHGAGCLVIVSDGKLDCLEVYANAGTWPDEPQLVSLGAALPLPVVAPAT